MAAGRRSPNRHCVRAAASLSPLFELCALPPTPPGRYLQNHTSPDGFKPSLMRFPQASNAPITTALAGVETHCSRQSRDHVWEPRRGGLIIFLAVEIALLSPPLRTFIMPRSAASKPVRLARPAPSDSGSDTAMAERMSTDPRRHWLKAFRTVREETEARAALLSAEDQVVQSMPDTSPTKWHRAHVTWFFEQFLLRPHAKNYRPFDERFAYLYNSYYVSAGPRQARPQRGLITRPTVAEVAAYRAHVDKAVTDYIQTAKNLDKLIPISEIVPQHEQHHQEVLLTYILQAFSFNETHLAYDPDWQWPQNEGKRAASGSRIAGVHSIGHDGDGFSF